MLSFDPFDRCNALGLRRVERLRAVGIRPVVFARDERDRERSTGSGRCDRSDDGFPVPLGRFSPDAAAAAVAAADPDVLLPARLY